MIEALRRTLRIAKKNTIAYCSFAFFFCCCLYDFYSILRENKLTSVPDLKGPKGIGHL